MHTGDVPCAHRAAQDNQKNRNNRNEQRIPEALEELCLLNRCLVVHESDKCPADACLPSRKALRKLDIGNSKRICKNIGLSLEGV